MSIKQLHPTLKKCKCGFTGKRNQFYVHMDQVSKQITDNKVLFANHGEVPLNENDPETLLH